MSIPFMERNVQDNRENEPAMGAGRPVAVVARSGVGQQQVASLARRLGLPLAPAGGGGDGFRLRMTETGLELLPPGADGAGPVRVDFAGGRNAHRRRFGGGAGQPLARAVGLKGGLRPRVLDATAGMGRDAFVLATLGCEVTLVERSPVVWALLEDGIRRAAGAGDPELRAIASRMRPVFADAIGHLEGLPEAAAPDVVYLDPMYPVSGKTARAKKEMRVVRELLGGDGDSPRLLAAALGCARCRVVVKRPARAGFLGGERPSMSIGSPNTRYDVYVRRGMISR